MFRRGTFKASKYRNAAPFPQKPDLVIRELSLGSYLSHGNFIAASAGYMAFNWGRGGNSLAVLPIGATGRQNNEVPLIHAGAEFVSDFQFSPFDDGILATGSNDTLVKIWRIPEEGMPVGGLTSPELELEPQVRRIETVNFNPTADGVLATGCSTSVVVWDLFEAKEMFAFDGHEDDVQSVSWQVSGQLLATQSKDRNLRIIDPRNPQSEANICESHRGIKDSKVVWLSDNNRVLTSGFSQDRSRELIIRDIRNLSQPQKSLSLDISSGILIPLYDPDTNMFFLAGKGDRNIQFIEVTDSEPFIVEGLRHSGEQTKGACLVPKRAMDVMNGEVNRTLQLCDSSIVPVTWQVPRKSYKEYHADIYPETNGFDAMMGPTEWSRGEDTSVPKINLDPKKRPKEVLTVFRQGPLNSRKRDYADAALSRKSSISSASEQSMSSPVKEDKTGKSSSEKVFPTPCNAGDTSNNGGVQNAFVKPSPRPRSKLSRTNTGSSDHSDDSLDSPKPKRLDSPFTNNTNPKPQPRRQNSSTVSQNGGGGGDSVFATPAHQKQPNGGTSLVGSADKMPKNGVTTNGGTENNKNGSASKDNKNVDEGLVALRRQPSIRDRRKMFEDNIRKSQSEASIDVSKVKTPVTKTPSLLPTREKSEENAGKPSKPAVVLRPKVSPEPSSLRPVSMSMSSSSRGKSIFGGRLSKFKHLKGDVVLKGKFDNLKNLSRTVPGESNFFHANPDRVAVPIAGPGGKIAIFDTNKPGRIPDGVQPALINGSTVLDFAFDPFDNNRLVAACDDGHLRVWKIPDEGLLSPTNDPELDFSAHSDKIQMVKFHPLAKDVLLTVAFDKSVKIWNLNDISEPAIELNGHDEPLFGVDWSPCGTFIATACKDSKVRIYEPRSSNEPIREGGHIPPKKGARIIWVLDGQYLVVTGFTKQAQRQVLLLRSSDLVEVAQKEFEVSPTIMIPLYDPDSSTLFVTGKGESQVFTYEVADESPYLFELSPYRPSGLHQGLAFLPKNVCSVRDVEFAKAYRLTDTSIEPISFTVPRVKTNFFQDDLFPDTRLTWNPTLTAEEWLGGSTRQPEYVSLKPDDMKALTGARGSGHFSKSNTLE